MASENGPQADTLTYLKEVAEAPWNHGFFRTVREIDCRAGGKAPTGARFHSADDPVRFTQEPNTSFAPSTLTEVTFDDTPYPKLQQRFIGLFGPNGPLPLHLTEYARDRSRHQHDHAFRAFADTFHHRIVSLFYRAWAVAQPTVQFDNPEADDFSRQVSSLAGYGTRGLKEADEFAHHAKLFFTGHLASLPRHAQGLEAMVSGYFDVDARVVEFVAHWLTIPKRDRLMLGERGVTGALGQDTIIGERVWQRQDKFQLRIGPLGLDEYRAFLPGGRAFRALVAVVRNYVGLEALWEAALVLRGRERPLTRLGEFGELGWTSWLGTETNDEDIDHLVLQVEHYTSQETHREFAS